VGGDDLLETADFALSRREVIERDAFSVPVACLAVDDGCSLAGNDGVLEAPHVPQRTSELAEGSAFAFPVLQVTGNAQRASRERDPVIEVPTQFEEPPQVEGKISDQLAGG
jgi:hypothetical protein